jgi:carbohydrate diacid regulator
MNIATAAPLQQVAETVTHRTAEMLCTAVTMLDDRGDLIASSNPNAVPPDHAEADSVEGYIQLPIRLGGRSLQVLVAEPRDGEVISPRLARVILELAINQSAVVERLPNQVEIKNKFIYDLLRGAASDEADILRESQILGMDFARPRAVILIDAADYIMVSHPGASDARARRSAMRAQHLIASVVNYFRLPSDAICAYIGEGEVAVLKAATNQDLTMWTGADLDAGQANPSWANLAALKRACSGLLDRLRRDTATSISVGIGRYHPGIHGLARSYQDAGAALALGRRFHGPNRVHCLDELGVAAFMGVPDERTKVELAVHLLSPLDHEPELHETLQTLFDENCCPSATSRRLSIHRNTLAYRLDKITSLTGLDPRRFDDAVQMRLASVLRAL